MHNKNKSIQRVVAVILSFIFLVSTAYADVSTSDANNGEYLGFRLGDRFDTPRGSKSRIHITGATIIDLDPGKYSHHVDSITIYVSPVSSLIGSILGAWYFADDRAATIFADRYLGSLAAKYPGWKRSGSSLTHGSYQLWVEVEQRPYITEHWPSRDDFRVNIGLIYAPDSDRRADWMAMIDKEANNRALTAQQ